jgi:hypothetical protein
MTNHDPATDPQTLSGRELDAEVAREVMGWKVEVYPHGHVIYLKPRGGWDQVPAFSANIGAAMQILAHLQKQGRGWVNMTYAIGYHPENFNIPGWLVQFRRKESSWAWGETLELALSRAALACVRAGKEQTL